MLIIASFTSCISTPVNSTRNNAGSNYTGSSYTTPPKKAETEIIFTFNGPQGVIERLYYNGQSLGNIEPDKRVTKTIPNNEGDFTLKVQIGEEMKEIHLAARGSTTINVNISVRRTPSGIVITDFGIVDRSPMYSVRYVSVDSLNVRNNSNADATWLDVIPQDCLRNKDI